MEMITEDEMIKDHHNQRVEVIEVNVFDVKTSKQLHETLKQSLGFPSFYGMNWDAFWDAITGLVEMPKKLVIIGWANIVKTIPNDAKNLKMLLEKLNERHPSWGCEVEYK
jgi:RNAse (barnase) inhibitor barstar